MGVTDEESETTHLLIPDNKVPRDSFHLAYITYFTLGTGYLLPWNAFITAVDYFSYLYPDKSVDRVFAIVYMLLCLICLLVVIASELKLTSFARINAGLAFFLVALTALPLMDALYVKGKVGMYPAYYVTVCLMGLCGMGDALVQGSLIGTAGELPERYMQAVIAGTAASGVIVNLLRIFTKAAYPQDAHGLRSSANLYFIVSIAAMVLCLVLYNMAPKLPVIRYYNDLKAQAVNNEKHEKGDKDSWKSTLWNVFRTIKWFGFASFIINTVILSIFPGFITEDVHSVLLGDWYPVILITSYNLFDLIGKSLTSLYVVEDAKVAIAASFGMLLYLPLFYGCLHGPRFFRTEIPVTILTCLMGVTSGYLISVLMILAPKTVQLQHAETTGIVLVLFLVVGLSIGSIVSWVWVI